MNWPRTYHISRAAVACIVLVVHEANGILGLGMYMPSTKGLEHATEGSALVGQGSMHLC
jgi:hypothetical protein